MEPINELSSLILKSACAVTVKAVSPTKLGENKKNVSKSTNLPRVERQKGQQHVGKAENREKALKTIVRQGLCDMVKVKLPEAQF